MFLKLGIHVPRKYLGEGEGSCLVKEEKVGTRQQ